jgi:signal transduction histidine kinase
MARDWKFEVRQTIVQCFLGGIVLGLVTFACFDLGLKVAVSAFSYLTVLVLLSLRVNFAASILLLLAAVACLVYFFAAPIFNFKIELGRDAAVIGSFVLTAFIVSSLVARARNQTQVALQAAEALRRSEAYLEEGQRLTHTGSWAWNVATRENVYWSLENFRIFGLDPSKDTSSFANAIQRIHPVDLAGFMQTLDIAIEEKRDFEVGWRILLPDGSIRRVRSIGHPVVDENGTVVEFVGTLVDETERKLAEEKLKLSEAFLADAGRVSHTGSFARRRASDETLWSSETRRIFEVEPGVVPTLELALQRTHPDDRALVQIRLNEGINPGGPSRDDEYRLQMPDGRIKYVRTLRGAPGPELEEHFSVIGTVMDVTERKQAEEALRKAQADLAHASRVSMMGELAATLAHEVNQPIAATVTNANASLRWLDRDTPDLDEARAALLRIVDDGTRAAEIISRTRAFFKKGIAQHELVDVDEAVRNTILLVRSETMRYSISVRTFLAAGFPQVKGDRVQLQQVVMNLLLNSIDALKDVDGKRELIVRSQRTDGEEIVVSVSDTGVGLPPQQSDQIFEAFVTTKSSGTGMGLSISRTIVEAHGGRLSATANTPRGAVFTFTLPISDDTSEA